MRRNEELRQVLLRFGLSTARDLCRHLEISQPTLSRLLADLEKEILRTGKGKQTRYALRGLLPTGHDRLTLYTINAEGKASLAGNLHAVRPQGYYLESLSETLSSRFHQNLPYLFEDLRPSGFLGRLIPRLLPQEKFPPDIQNWTDDDCLRYLAQYGWDLIGDTILGDGAYELYVQNRLRGLDVLPEEKREGEYPRLVDLVLSTGVPGSSAAGEQPKFLSIRTAKAGHVPVLVKFSPPVGEAVGRRIADLLICEHIAHETLRAHGRPAAQSSLLSAGERMFLEIERFDRTAAGGRKGVISLRALDLEFVGSLRSWSETAEALRDQKKIDEEDFKKIVWLETFGKLIGNTDRHHGNISFFISGEKLLGLTPVYDMLPMLYAPQLNQIVTRSLEPSPPKFNEIPVWSQALAAAMDFWERVASHSLISASFREMTGENGQRLIELAKFAPVSPPDREG